MLVQGLNDSARQIHENNKAKGFWANGAESQNVGELLMLVVSELGEAMEAHRKGKFANIDELKRLVHSQYGEDYPFCFELLRMKLQTQLSDY